MSFFYDSQYYIFPPQQPYHFQFQQPFYHVQQEPYLLEFQTINHIQDPSLEDLVRTMATLYQPQPTPQIQEPSLKEFVKTMVANQLQFQQETMTSI